MSSPNSRSPHDANRTHPETLSDLPRLLRDFFSNPVKTMRMPMRLTWPASLSLQGGGAMVSGALFGALSGSVFDLLIGILIFPIAAVAISLLLTLFLFYFFMLFRSTLLEFKRLYGLVALATFPYFIIHVGSGFIPPLDLIAFAAASVLLIVGLVEQFGLQRKLVISVISGLYTGFFVAWAVAQLI